MRSGLLGLILAAMLLPSGMSTNVHAETATAEETVCDPYCYNGAYLFAVTREVRDRSNPALALVLSPATFAFDLAFLPFAAALGLLG